MILLDRSPFDYQTSIRPESDDFDPPAATTLKMLC